MALVIQPGLFKILFNVQSFMEIPRDTIMKKIGLIPPDEGWEYLKVKVIDNIEAGIEVQENVPTFNDANEIKSLADQAVELAIVHFGDMLVRADVQVKVQQLPVENKLMTAHHVDFHLKRDLSKFIQIDILYDPDSNSYQINSIVYRHRIDGAPLILLIKLIHNHLILKEKSFLSCCERTPKSNLQSHFDRFKIHVDETKWQAVIPSSEDEFECIGAQIDISESNIRKLRRQITKDNNLLATSSSVELALLAMEMNLNYATDCVARGRQNKRGRIDMQSGYRGLGHVQTNGYAQVAHLDHDKKYGWLCDKIREANQEMVMEFNNRGKASKSYKKISRIPDVFRLSSDKITSYESVMSVACCQILSTNLNGLEYGVPICVGNVKPENIKGYGVPATPSHSREIREIREKKGIKGEITEMSFCCGERLKGTSYVYKALKTKAKISRQILQNWGYDQSELDGMSKEALVKQLFMDCFRPDSPLEGRIEKLAGSFLKSGGRSAPIRYASVSKKDSLKN